MGDPLRLEWTTDAGARESVEFDATWHQVYERGSSVEEHAVERGAAVTDHVRPQAYTFKLEGMVSNTVTRTRLSFLDGATVSTGSIALPGGRSVTGLRLSRTVDRRRVAAAVLFDLQTDGTLVTLRSPRGVWNDMVIERVGHDWDVETGGALPIALDFKQIRFAESETVPVSAPSTRRQQRPQQRGAQPTTPPATPEQRRRSLLVQAGHAFGVPLPGDP